MSKKKTAAQSLVRAADKLRQKERTGQDVKKQQAKVDRAVQLFRGKNG